MIAKGMEMRFHHFGLAARDPARASAFVSHCGYVIGPEIHDPIQKVNLRWCEKPGQPAIEIVSPGADGDGPLASVLSSNPSSFYHLCYEIDGPAEHSVETMRHAGLRVVTVLRPVPAVLFRGRNVSFHIVQGFGLVELLESPGNQ